MPLRGVINVLITFFVMVAILSGMAAVSDPQVKQAAPRAEAREDDGLKPPPVDFSKIVKKLQAGVVAIKVEKNNEESGLPEDHPPIPPRYRHSEGSGFVVSKSGLIMTNSHVVSGAKDISVTFSDKSEVKAEVVGEDPGFDLALIKIKPKNDLKVLKLGDSGKVKTGEWVIAMGNPLGLENNVSIGIVSGKKREFPDLPLVDFIQTDAGIYPGSSGGPLVDADGEVIGINTAAIPDTKIGLSVPANEIKEILPLLKKGDIKRGYIGAFVIDPIKDAELEGPKGALVDLIDPGSPAESSGLIEGDIIVEFDDKAIENPRDLALSEAKKKPGDTVKLKVDREGSETEVEITLDEATSATE